MMGACITKPIARREFQSWESDPVLQEYLWRTWSISVFDLLAIQVGENCGQDQPTGGIQWMRKGDLLCDSIASVSHASSFRYEKEGERSTRFQSLTKHFDDGHDKLGT